MLFGYLNTSFLNIWSLQHFAAGVMMGSILHALFPGISQSWLKFTVMVILLALIWEFVEELVEARFLSGKNNVESFANRYISDPLMAILGALAAKKVSNLWKILIVPMLIWLAYNLPQQTSIF